MMLGSAFKLFQYKTRQRHGQTDGQSTYHAGPTVWNSLPDELGNSDSFDSF